MPNAKRQTPNACAGYHEALSRRGFLLAGGMLVSSTAIAQLAMNPRRESDRVLVTIFLRGGADGLNLVAPYGEDDYHKARPSLALSKQEVVDLDGFFGLHPKLSPLFPSYESQDLAIIHAVGSQDQTRSHFEAMSAMERGVGQAESPASSGWLARYLDNSAPAHSSPLRAVAFSSVMPDSLRGATHATALSSISDYRLQTPANLGDEDLLVEKLRAQYADKKDAMALAGQETLAVLKVLKKLDTTRYRPLNQAAYPQTDLAKGLQEVAMLIRSDVGLEVACLDLGGWDTHVIQGGSTGLQANLIQDLAGSLAAFAKDLGNGLRKVTVVVMTEFGRRVEENSGLGTDHGRASAMFVLGGGVTGGKIHTKWPGLKPEQREGPGDLRVTTDYRNVLSDVLRQSMGFADTSAVFPGSTPGPQVISFGRV